MDREYFRSSTFCQLFVNVFIIKYLWNTLLIINTNNNNDLSPLEWWQVNGGKYRNVARVAQNLLGVPENSTPRELVLSICGLVDTSEQLNILEVSIENEVFCNNNMEKFHELPKYCISFYVNL